MSDVDEDRLLLWYVTGTDAYRDGGRDADLLPPLNDEDAQGWWLMGFVVAALNAGLTIATDDLDPLFKALERVLADHNDVLKQIIDGLRERREQYLPKLH
ncbi:MAG: hypothetical protein MUC77_20750 [Chromatiaceae bacterium]|jgi:hypothetical protein|nr:hypothetical protein [Chromatiaceae bacterium]